MIPAVDADATKKKKKKKKKKNKSHHHHHNFQLHFIVGFICGTIVRTIWYVAYGGATTRTSIITDSRILYGTLILLLLEHIVLYLIVLWHWRRQQGSSSSSASSSSLYWRCSPWWAFTGLYIAAGNICGMFLVTVITTPGGITIQSLLSRFDVILQLTFVVLIMHCYFQRIFRQEPSSTNDDDGVLVVMGANDNNVIDGSLI